MDMHEITSAIIVRGADHPTMVEDGAGKTSARPTAARMLLVMIAAPIEVH
jgi:hypothetical protein